MPDAADAPPSGRRLGVWFGLLACCALGVSVVGHPQRKGFTNLDASAVVLTSMSLGAWLMARRGPWAAELILAGTASLTVAHFLAFRHFPMLIVLVLSMAAWLIATASLFAGSLRRACLPAFCTVLVLGCLAAAETWFVLAPLWGPQEFEQITGKLSEPDPQMSSIALPNATVRHKKADFEVTYHTGPDRDRVVPGRPETGPRWSLFGGSFAFGWGLNDGQAIAGRLQTLDPQARVFNCAMRGHGTADVYIRLGRELEEHPDTKLCVYFLIVDHFRRTSCPDSLTAQPWGMAKPRFALPNGKPVLLGRAADTLSLPGRFNVHLLRQSRLYEALYPPWRPSADDLKLVASLIVGMNDACDALPDCRFLLVRLPLGRGAMEGRMAWTEEAFKRWLDDLAGNGVAVLDWASRFSEQLDATGHSEQEYFFTDRHPNSRYAAVIAEWLNEELRARDWAEVALSY